MNQRQIVFGGFFVARCDRSEAFEPVNEELHVKADTVELAVQTPLGVAAGIAVDDRLHAAGAHQRDVPVGIVTGIGDHRTAARVRDELLGHRAVVLLTRGQRDVDRASMRIDNGVELR